MLLAIIGASVGSAIELAHQHFGVWILQSSRELPLWIGVVYFVGLLAAGRLFFHIAPTRPLGTKRRKPSVPEHSGSREPTLRGPETSSNSQSFRALVGRGFEKTCANWLVAWDVGVALVLFAAPIFLHTHEVWFAWITWGYLLARLALVRSRASVVVALAAAMLDGVVELLLIQGLHLYTYANASLLELPLWLAPLWGGIGLGLWRGFSWTHAERIRPSP